jgi:drug/metabolite transporter (DMT)-like permease
VREAPARERLGWRSAKPPLPRAPGGRRVVPADLLLLAIVILWAFNFTAIRYAVSHGFEPLTFASVRWSIAALAYSAVTWQLEGSLRVSRRDLGLLAVLAACGLWLNQIAVTYAVKLASAATVALLFGTLPAFIALFSRFAGVQCLRAREWAGIGVSFAGVVLIAVGGGRISAHAVGVVLAILTAATFAAYSVGVVPLMRRYSPYRISAMTASIGALLLAASGSWQLARQSWDMGALAWGAVLYGSLAAVGLGNLLWFKVIDRVGPGRAAVYLNLQPFLGAVFALVVLSESLKPIQVAGGLVVGAGIVLARVRPQAASGLSE